MKTLFFGLLALVVFCLVAREFQKLLVLDNALKATHDDCNADGPFFAWCVSHPDNIPISSDPYAVALLQRKIATYKQFLATHPHVKDNGHLALLESHLE